MLSDVCDNDRFVELFVDRVKNIKRSHERTISHGKWMLILPCFDFGEPFMGSAVGNVLVPFL